MLKESRDGLSVFRAILAIVCVGLVALPSFIAASDPIDRSKRVPIKPTIPSVDRYQSDKVFLEHADELRYKERPIIPGLEEYVPEQYKVLVGNVRFRKGDMYMFCDSAYFYESGNSIDAFSNVRMEQGDTLFVYADELNYDGETELAVLYADAGKKVRLINRDVELKTDVFNYDMANEIGYYNVGGTLTDRENILTSWEGEYYPSTKYAYFYRDVKLESRGKSDTLRMFTDSLVYNTDTHIAQLICETLIVNADGEIRSTSGTYNTETGIADLYRRSLVKTRRGNTLTGDTLFYDRDTGIGEAFGNMILTDSARQSSLHGNYGYYNDLLDSAFVTGRALAKEYSRGDTLYLHGDTINAYVDPVDSMRITNAFHKVRFYRSDMQGLCDSLSVSERDSLLYMYRMPVVWSDKRQIFGNVIYLHLNDSTFDWARLPENGFMAEHIAEDCFNQLSGADMTAWFNDSTLSRLYVEGNVQIIMFPMENDSTYNKYAYVESSTMDAYFKNQTVDSIRMWPATSGNVVPLYLAKKSSYFLPKFAWYEDLRPTSPSDVFVIPDEMISLIESAPPVKPREKPKKSDLKPNKNAPEVSAESAAGGNDTGEDLPTEDEGYLPEEPDDVQADEKELEESEESEDNKSDGDGEASSV